ncbi:MFS inorganic phosphate transporter [Lentinula aciculospora]|uniref:MFS inorganic phosphate transporter n=1 Tax=Lentinula aciculospora TaxID=153920 RepID=A0A9W9DFZ0_9AGAR|nr:MFS inorganic phosphate transporter [Lentinula aciculospora]
MSSAQENEREVSASVPLEEIERSGKPAFVLSLTEVKLLGIAGVGFFLDAYDLFIINPVLTMLQYRLYGGNAPPVGLHGFVNAAANIGSVIGQFTFGYLADSLGRSAIYGKELMLIIFATIMCLTTPTGSLSPNGSLIYLGVFRIILGIGVGGDYPMSASVTSDRSNLYKRGTMLAYIFANQGWGSFIGSLNTVIVLACYKHVMNDEGETSKADGVWRIVVALSLIPAFATLYQRLTMPESKRFNEARRLAENQEADLEKEIRVLKDVGNRTEGITASDSHSGSDIEKEDRVQESTAHSSHEVSASPEVIATKKDKAQIGEFIAYFSEWRHAKLLIGTCICWFLLDIAFYGINLNQNVVLTQIGFAGKTGSDWEKLFKVSTGNLIVTALGFVPGYYATVLLIEKLGRKWIQIQGFLLAALFLGILAGKFNTLSNAAFIVNFALLQFFFNFGANATTYCYPAEVFPTRFRAFAHGISAASGKAGAIISALAFNALSADIGTPAVLWIFFGCCIAGAFFTLLLPEVKGRDPDLILAQEIREARANQQVLKGVM